jgi:hypothetical protein
MKRSFQIQLHRIEARIPYDSLKRAEAQQAYDEILTQSEPEVWEWILSVNPKEVEESLPPSQHSMDDEKYSHFVAAYLLASTRGWDNNYTSYIGSTDFHWEFSLDRRGLFPKNQKDWSLLYLMGLTPAQFEKRIPPEKREAIMAEARQRVDTRFEELGPQNVTLRHPKKLFQAIRDLNLPELYKTPC